jgi:hypothetical protein
MAPATLALHQAIRRDAFTIQEGDVPAAERPLWHAPQRSTIREQRQQRAAQTRPARPYLRGQLAPTMRKILSPPLAQRPFDMPRESQLLVVT